MKGFEMSVTEQVDYGYIIVCVYTRGVQMKTLKITTKNRNAARFSSKLATVLLMV